MQEEFYNNNYILNKLEEKKIKRPIVVIVIGYIIGIIWGLYLKNSIVLLYILIIALYLIKKLFILKKDKKFKLFSFKRYFRYIKIIITKNVILTIIISSIISNTILLFKENKYNNLYKEENMKIDGIIISNKEEKEFKNRYKLKVLKANDMEKYKNTQIYIELKKSDNIEYGDRIICYGNFLFGNEQRNQNGYNYKLYLKSIKIYGTLSVNNYKKISSPNISIVNRKINQIRLYISNNIDVILKDNIGTIVKGLILGDISNLDIDIKEKFQIVNIAHILAVSGMHIAYIVTCIEKILKPVFGQRKIQYIIILSLLFYMSLTNFTNSIVRAGIMEIINIMSFLLYRKKDTWTSMAFSLLCILINNPYSIISIGLQLSYLGTIGVILFNKNIKGFLEKVNIRIKNGGYLFNIVEKLSEIISVTLSAQIMLFPIIIYHFNLIGIYFLLSNILVGIILGSIMLLSIIFVITLFINIGISKFISIFLLLEIKFIIGITNLSKLPFAKIYIATPNILCLCIYYVIVLVCNQLYKIYTNTKINATNQRVKNVISYIKYKITIKKTNFYKKYIKVFKTKKNKKCIILIYKKILINLFLIFSLVNILKLNNKLEIHFLDVGQGDSSFIITPNNKTILIDGGGSASSSFDVGKKILVPYILDKGYTKIDYIFVSHFDQDHIGGILTILDELKVGQIFISKQEKSSINYEKFLHLINQKKVKVKEVTAGDKIIIDNIDFKIIWPIQKQIEENMLNNNAIVLKLQYKNFKMLFTGDIEEIAEKDILVYYKNNLKILKANVLKVAHHGSKSSSSEKFLQEVSPEYALIGVGKNNNFGHPHQIVLDRLEKLKIKTFRTDECGEIIIKTNGRKMNCRVNV